VPPKPSPKKPSAKEEKDAPKPPRGKAQPKPPPDPGDAVREILVEAARTQLAAVTAATTFWAGWAEMAQKYAQSLSEELAELDKEETEAGELLGRITDLTREYLRNLTELPTTSVQHFNTQLERIGNRPGRRNRAARVKP
jgi:hypothetical protein